MKAASENLVPVTLELGGKSPQVVFADCPDLDAAAQARAARQVPAPAARVIRAAGRSDGGHWPFTIDALGITGVSSSCRKRMSSSLRKTFT